MNPVPDPEVLATILSNGSVTAVILLLILIIISLLWERNRMIKKTDETLLLMMESKKHEMESIRQIIDLYHQGNLNLVQTLTEIKSVLMHMQPR